MMPHLHEGGPEAIADELIQHFRVKGEADQRKIRHAIGKAYMIGKQVGIAEGIEHQKEIAHHG